jgi:uncharacterized protein with HEPN domain
MITAAMLSLIQQCGEGALVLTDGLEQADLLRSRLTRDATRQQLRTLADTLAGLSERARQAIPEIDWAGWRAVRATLDTPGPAQDEALWFAVRSLVPATLSWLRIYRHNSPELFDWTEPP